MFDILLVNKISDIGTKLFDNKYNLVSEHESPDAILIRSTDIKTMEMPKNLKAIARAGAGVNNIPVDKCTEQGIVVFNTPGANANAVKELVIGALIVASRNIVDGANWVKTLKDNVEALVETGKSQFAGTEILGKTIGIAGLGAIGVLVANACASLGLNVIGYDPYVSISNAFRLSSKVKITESLDEMCSLCDFISLHIPELPATKGMINKQAISKMKPNVKILNFSRAGLVNNKDILEAIEQKTIAGYITDFPTDDLINIDNITCIPHLGASTEESEENCAVMAVEQMINYLEHGNIKNSVNLPDCELPTSDNKRICIINKNIPNVIGEITKILSEQNLNIDNMINKSKGQYSYNIIDVVGDVDNNITEKLKQTKSIISVRVI